MHIEAKKVEFYADRRLGGQKFLTVGIHSIDGVSTYVDGKDVKIDAARVRVTTAGFNTILIEPFTYLEFAKEHLDVVLEEPLNEFPKLNPQYLRITIK